MDWNFYAAISFVIIMYLLGISLAIANLKDTDRKQRQLAIRRAYKKAKNERLKRFYHLD